MLGIVTLGIPHGARGTSIAGSQLDPGIKGAVWSGHCYANLTLRLVAAVPLDTFPLLAVYQDLNSLGALKKG